MSTAERVAPGQRGWLPRWIFRWGERLADWPNPIVVKELRQAVRGWTALALFVLYLVVQLLVVGMMLMSSAGDLLSERPMGNQVFLAVQIQLVVVIMGLLPIYAGVRLFLERSDVNLDLMFITPLRPVWIVLGKLLAALVLGLLFFSVSAPVMTMAYFLRGLDLIKAAILLGLDLVLMVAAVQVALFVAALPVPRPLAAIFGILLLLGLFISVMGMAIYSVSMFDSLWRPDEDWVTPVMIVLSALFVTLFTFTATHALLSPPPSNRLLFFKLMLAFGPVTFWVLLVTIGWLVIDMSNVVGLSNFLYFLEFCVLGLPKTLTLISWLAWAMAVSERLQWGPRILNQVPRPRWLRILVFPFYTGAANGLVFALLLTALRWLAFGTFTFVGDVFSHALLHSVGGHPNRSSLRPSELGLKTEVLADLYLITYSLMAFHLRRYLEQQRSKTLPGWVLLLVLLGLVSFVQVLFAIVGSLLEVRDELIALLFTLAPVPMLESLVGVELLSTNRDMVSAVSFVILLVALPLLAVPTLIWWLKQVRLFRPPPPKSAMLTEERGESLAMVQAEGKQ
ncbi:MAG: hypothetical protein RMI91_04245 [Gemmatales bacterium]|nr:hypothetical protein [Gemmatales bacterium]MDW7993845.1 hypothetical protein [Gemmatales bacterium]